MAITYRFNAIGALNSGGGTAPVTFSTIPTDGDLVIATFHFYQTGTVSSVADNKGNSYSLAKRQQNGSSYGVEIWYAENVSGSASWTVTGTLSGSVYCFASVCSWGGMKTSGSLGNVNGGQGYSTTESPGTISAADQSLYLSGYTQGETCITWTPNYNWIVSECAGATYHCGVQYGTGTGVKDINGGINTNATWAAAVAAFAEAPAAVVRNPVPMGFVVS